MPIQIDAFDPDDNGLGILSNQYFANKFAYFDNVAGMLSTDAGATQYAFIGPDGGGIVFYASGGWVLDPETGALTGSLDQITFGQQTQTLPDGTFSQTVETQISGLTISDQDDLNALFAQAADGNFGHFTPGEPNSLYDILDTESWSVTGSPGQDMLVTTPFGGVVHAGAGNDRIYGAEGNDRIVGGDGNDRINGGGGDNVIYGGDGDDLIGGGSGNDRIIGGSGNDTINAGSGRNVIYGGDGDDSMTSTGYQAAIIKGGSGDDLISGGRVGDKLYGDDGQDYINGWHGNDRIYGGTGNDILTGGMGIDTFVFQKGAGDDLITDFQPGKAGKDLIIFDDTGLTSFRDLMDHAVQIKGDVFISYDEGSLLLQGTKLSQFDSHDFLFT